jgi:hypothetical protein
VPATVAPPAATVTEWMVPPVALTTTGSAGETLPASAAGVKVTLTGTVVGTPPGPSDEPGWPHRVLELAPAADVQPASAAPAATPTAPVII